MRLVVILFLFSFCFSKYDTRDSLNRLILDVSKTENDRGRKGTKGDSKNFILKEGSFDGEVYKNVMNIA